MSKMEDALEYLTDNLNLNHLIAKITRDFTSCFDDFMFECLKPYGFATKDDVVANHSRILLVSARASSMFFRLTRVYIDGKYCFSVSVALNSEQNSNSSSNTDVKIVDYNYRWYCSKFVESV